MGRLIHARLRRYLSDSLLCLVPLVPLQSQVRDDILAPALFALALLLATDSVRLRARARWLLFALLVTLMFMAFHWLPKRNFPSLLLLYAAPFLLVAFWLLVRWRLNNEA